MNTIALAYVNSNNEIVAWSADSFGTPYKYPKTYEDSPQTREMLMKKFEKHKHETDVAIEALSSLNPHAALLIEDSADNSAKKFKEKGVVDSRIVVLHLETDYKKNLPHLQSVKDCIDNKDYHFYEVETI